MDSRKYHATKLSWNFNHTPHFVSLLHCSPPSLSWNPHPRHIPANQLSPPATLHTSTSSKVHPQSPHLSWPCDDPSASSATWPSCPAPLWLLWPSSPGPSSAPAPSAVPRPGVCSSPNAGRRLRDRSHRGAGCRRCRTCGQRPYLICFGHWPCATACLFGSVIWKSGSLWGRGGGVPRALAQRGGPEYSWL